jgi:hypothetical protein
MRTLSLVLACLFSVLLGGCFLCPHITHANATIPAGDANTHDSDVEIVAKALAPLGYKTVYTESAYIEDREPMVDFERQNGFFAPPAPGVLYRPATHELAIFHDTGTSTTPISSQIQEAIAQQFKSARGVDVIFRCFTTAACWP